MKIWSMMMKSIHGGRPYHEVHHDIMIPRYLLKKLKIDHFLKTIKLGN